MSPVPNLSSSERGRTEIRGTDEEHLPVKALLPASAADTSVTVTVIRRSIRHAFYHLLRKNVNLALRRSSNGARPYYSILSVPIRWLIVMALRCISGSLVKIITTIDIRHIEAPVPIRDGCLF